MRQRAREATASPRDGAGEASLTIAEGVRSG